MIRQQFCNQLANTFSNLFNVNQLDTMAVELLDFFKLCQATVEYQLLIFDYATLPILLEKTNLIWQFIASQLLIRTTFPRILLVFVQDYLYIAMWGSAIDTVQSLGIQYSHPCDYLSQVNYRLVSYFILHCQILGH